MQCDLQIFRTLQSISCFVFKTSIEDVMSHENTAMCERTVHVRFRKLRAEQNQHRREDLSWIHHVDIDVPH